MAGRFGLQHGTARIEEIYVFGNVYVAEDKRVIEFAREMEVTLEVSFVEPNEDVPFVNEFIYRKSFRPVSPGTSARSAPWPTCLGLSQPTLACRARRSGPSLEF